VPAFAAAQPYEQSEIAMHAGSAKIFLNNGAADPWLTIPGKDYINKNDAHLLPLSFIYWFNAFDEIKSATLILKDSTSAVVKKIELTSDAPMQSVSVNFHTNEELVKTLKHAAVNADQMYTLEVTGSGGYSKTFNNLLFAHDELHAERYYGVIDLIVKPASANFHLLDAGGNLITRILPLGTKQAAPVFELWMKSKLAFWQYAHNLRKKFKLTPTTQDLLADNSGILVSKNPVPMSFSPVKLKKPDSTFQFLPNPDPALDVKKDGSKILLNMQLPASTLFPLL
jgi:hypothetical protein